MINMDPSRLPSYLRGATDSELATLAQQARNPRIVAAVQDEMSRRSGGLMAEDMVPPPGAVPQQAQQPVMPAVTLKDVASEGWVPPWERPDGGSPFITALQREGPVPDDSGPSFERYGRGMPNSGSPETAPVRPPMMSDLPEIDVGYAPGAGAEEPDDVDLPPETVELAKSLEAAGDDPDAMQAILAELQGGIQSKDDMRNNAIARAGFAMAASRNPYFFGALGEGGLAGLDAYEKSKQEALMNRVRGAELGRSEEEYQYAKKQRAEMEGEVGKLSPDEQRLYRLLGPDNFAQIMAAGLKPKNVDAKIEQYNYAQSQGYQGSFTDWLLEQKRASKSDTNVNVNMPKSIGKGDEKMAELGAEGYIAAQEVLPLFGIARDAAKNFGQSGPLGGPALLLERGKSYLGLPNNAAAGEVLQSMQTRLGVLQRMPGSGATSNMEMGLYMSAVPGLLNSQQGNIALADIGEKLAKRRMDNYQRWQNYVDEKGSSVGYEPNDEPLLSADEAAFLRSAASGSTITPSIDAVNTSGIPSGTVVTEIPPGFEDTE